MIGDAAGRPVRRPDARRRADRRRARARRHGRDRRGQRRLAVVGAARGAAEHAREHRQVPAARACRCSCWSARSSTARASPGAWSPSPRPASAARPARLPAVAILVAMVLGGISGSGPANAAAVGGVMIAAMAAARLSGGVLGQRRRRGGGHRHPDPAVDRLHRLQRQRARRVGAGAVRRRHGAGHPRRPRR